MKKIFTYLWLLYSVLFFTQELRDQKKVSYSFTINGTLARNTNYGEYDYYTGEQDKAIFAVGAFFLRSELNIPLNKTFTTGINIGLDYHSESQILAIPYFLNLEITISELDDDRFFIRGGLGKLLKISEAFEKGNYATAGIGYHIATDTSRKYILSLDFHQKQIDGFAKGKLNSLSIGFGVLFF